MTLHRNTNNTSISFHDSAKEPKQSYNHHCEVDVSVRVLPSTKHELKLNQTQIILSPSLPSPIMSDVKAMEDAYFDFNYSALESSVFSVNRMTGYIPETCNFWKH